MESRVMVICVRVLTDQANKVRSDLYLNRDVMLTRPKVG